jgi:hypothetical protein
MDCTTDSGASVALATADRFELQRSLLGQQLDVRTDKH